MKKMISRIAFLLFLLWPVSVLPVSATVIEAPFESEAAVEYGDRDALVIPDKYNTGAKGSLQVVESTFYIDGVKIGVGDGMSKLDLYYQTAGLPDELVVENYDFSATKFSIQHADRLDKKVKVTFRNCKFGSVINYSSAFAECIFEHCTFTHFAGSESSFDWCYFGSGADGDGIDPSSNCKFQNCLIADLIQPAQAAGGQHVDGFQLTGPASGANVNIHLQNCRFEVPCIPMSNPSGALNCPIAFTMHETGADDISITDCIANGGVYYTLMIGAKEDQITHFTLSVFF